MTSTLFSSIKNNQTIRLLICLGSPLLLLLLIVLLCLFLRPDSNNPVYSISAFDVSSFDLSASTDTISSEFTVGLTVRNPDRKRLIGYDHIVVIVSCGGAVIAKALLDHPIDVGPKNVSDSKVHFVATKVRLRKPCGIGSDGGIATVTFDVKVVFLIVKYTEGKVSPWTQIEIRLKCRGIGVVLKNATAADGVRVGSMIGPAKLCSIQKVFL